MELYDTIPKRTIRSVEELPTILRKKFGYKKRISPVEWYKEIRHRQAYKQHIEFMFKNFLHRMTQEAHGKLIEGFLDLNNPLSRARYHLPHWNDPVTDLTIHEAAFLSCGLKLAGHQSAVDTLEQLLNEWEKEAERSKGRPLLSREYEDAALAYAKYLEVSPIIFDDPVEPLTDHIGNPLLSYGRPLNGYPITVDTQFDDETLVKSFRAWLKDRREKDNEKVKRPFNQNDFDDWAHYKIRELFDLEVWAALTNVKILDRVIADYLWPSPPDSFSPLDVLRTTTRKKAVEVFSFPTCLRLYTQLRMEMGENFLT